MGTSTIWLAHAIATRRSGSICRPEKPLHRHTPAGGFALAIPWRPVSWLAGHRRRPAFPVSPWPHLDACSPLTVAGAATALVDTAPCSRHRQTSELRGGTAEGKRGYGAR